jgi:uncharacterized protein YbjT (DUF2867 family)
MRVLVVGAYGLIGGQVTARLLQEGHQVVGLGRSIGSAARRFSDVEWRAADLRGLGGQEWMSLLEGVEAVVNCAGALQDGPRDDLQSVHVGAARALAAACSERGIRRLVHVSAVGVDRRTGVFLSTKKSAEEALQATALDWVILRPGLVIAPVAYGGTALLRGLAALPFVVPVISARARIQTVSVEDVADAVVRSLAVTRTRFVCDLVEPQERSLAEILCAFRAWLGLAPAKVVALPGWLGWLAAKGADALAWLGWRSPMRTTAVEQLAHGITGRSRDAQDHLGLSLRSLPDTLAAWPGGVQERWFSRLYLMKPVILATLAIFWGVSGLVGLVQHAPAAALLRRAGLSPAGSDWLVYGGSAVDLIVALLTCFRPTATLALRSMLAVTVAYLAGATMLTPGLWSDPLGPLVKSVPIALLALVALSLMDER